MKTLPNVALPAMIGAIVAGALPNEVLANLRVVDAETGETIDRVLEANVATATLTRHAIEDGNLVREGDSFKIIDETRAIRIEWIEPPVTAVVAVEEGDA